MSEKDAMLMQKRHSLAHLLGAALTALYPEAKLAIGPAVDDGFYYDAELPVALSVDDLPKVEKKMRELISGWSSFEKQTISKDEALKQFADNPYKCELIEQLADEGKEITVYQSGDFY